jgi:hypothetical protein
MSRRITNVEGILHAPTCCECKQEVSPAVDLQLWLRIPILRISICTCRPICMTDSQCTLEKSKKKCCAYSVESICSEKDPLLSNDLSTYWTVTFFYYNICYVMFHFESAVVIVN